MLRQAVFERDRQEARHSGVTPNREIAGQSAVEIKPQNIAIRLPAGFAMPLASKSA
jgi:hypothetical protein